MEKVVVFGAGQGASLNYMVLTHDSPYQVEAFTVDRKYMKTAKLFGLPVVAFEEVESIYPPSEYKMSIFISYRKLNKIRAEKYDQAKSKGYQLINYISSRAVTFPDLTIGDNCFLFENASLGPFTTIGNNVFIGSGSLIGHNSIIKDHCFVGPCAVILGSTTIEPYCLIGANSTIRDGGVIIARECIISAGAVISQNTRERGVYIGNPAKLAPKNSDELSTWLTWGMK